ncbi:uroporphyrinogen decarboxylase family protein [Clostridium sp.]|uniref:uroporphyrinogen decarboxylase family protein n=1 Tax=Clostridium sp. TaxID=1506 RepID=UPI001A5A7620|nr:uroporphyrinogen decarboxylase family protein [Clostridium sp.]MBK5234720.1 thioredoxin family protein [Clostridium sp.]
MNSRELVLGALKNEEVTRAPWVPFVGCHGASLIGVNCEEYFKSVDNMVNGVTKAYELYRPDGLPALFDLQVEAEAMGCTLQYSESNPPAVTSHPLEDGIELNELKIPSESDGRFPIVLEATRKICSTLGDKIAIYGLITGPFTLALHLKGTDIFYEMMDEPENIQELMGFCLEVCKNTARMYMEAGVDIIAVVDPMVSQISPDNFEEFVSPYITPLFEYIKENEKLSSYFVCGDATRNIEPMCKCNPDSISIDENVALDFAKEICSKYGVSLGGNIKLTVTMLFGTPTDNINDAKNCLQIGGTKGYILSPGCDMPFNTPIENVKAVTSVVYGEVSEFLGAAGSLEDIDVQLPDYNNEAKVILDIITLDSESCAPCQYMVEAVNVAVKGLEDKVEWTEYSVKEKESVVRMIKLGVQNIPTICIDGEVKYISIIPSVEELRKSILEAITKKGL